MLQVHVCVRQVRVSEKHGPRQSTSVVYEMLTPAEKQIFDYRLLTVSGRLFRIVSDICGHLMPRRPEANPRATFMANAVMGNDAFTEDIGQSIQRRLIVSRYHYGCVRVIGLAWDWQQRMHC